MKIARFALVIALLIAIAPAALATPFINEIFIDPPGSEAPREYVELRGTPEMSLNNLWFIILENEDTPEQTGSVGSIDLAIDLSGSSIGSNGYLVMRRASNSPYTVAPNTALLELPTTLMENSGGTYMLIDRGEGPMPVAGMALDGEVDNDHDDMTPHDGLDYPGMGQPGWTILDAIGVFSEPTSGVMAGEAIYGRTYATLNFGPESPGRDYTWFEPSISQLVTETFQPNITEEQVYISTGFENELIARYGDSTGSDEHDWHVSNITDNGQAGASASNGIFAQAGSDPHGFPRQPADPEPAMGSNFGTYESESSQYVPYGTPMTTSLGAANYPVGEASLPWDYNGNGVVDAADFTVWRDQLGTPDPTGQSVVANADRDTSVDITDYDAWAYHFGETLPAAGSGAFAGGANVPEPASWLLIVTLVPTLSVGMRFHDARRRRVC